MSLRAPSIGRSCALALAVATLSGCTADPAEPAAGSASDNWPTYNGENTEARHSALADIDTGNVSQLGLAWSHDFDNSHAQEGTALVIGGTMFVTSAWNKVSALDAATGRELWNFDPKVPGNFQASACCDVVNRGAAYDAGKVFVATIDGRLIALDAKTGKPIWTTLTVDQSRPYTITGAPRVARGKVYIGNGGAEYGVRGYVSAYDENTGKQVWRFYTVPGKPGIKDGAASDAILEKLARPTWFGDKYWKLGGGGTVWDSIVYDAELGQLIVGVGNGGPWDRLYRSEGKGDNLFLGSVLALDPDTGAYRWHYQETPGDSWDFTSTQQITLATLKIDGAPRKVLLHAPKNGYFYVIDRGNGKLLAADKYVAGNWSERVDLRTGRPVESPGARYIDKPFLATVGSTGGHNWFPMSYDAASGLVFIPAQEIPQFYARDPAFKPTPGLWALGIDTAYGGLPDTPQKVAQAKKASKGRLIAWDPIARKPRWAVEHATGWNGGVLSTGGGLVFQGLADGTFRAYASANGKELWRFDARNTVLAGAMSYRAGGQQYVAVTVGGSAGTPAMGRLDGPLARPPGRVLAFRIGAKAKLPSQNPTLPPLSLVEGEWPAQRLAAGEKVYGKICAACHGFGTFSAGVIPDLKRSAYLGDAEAWRQVVMEGALVDGGMASFAKYISNEEAEDVRAYVADQARRAAGRR